jgi:hypothetical protein
MFLLEIVVYMIDIWKRQTALHISHTYANGIAESHDTSTSPTERVNSL